MSVVAGRTGRNLLLYCAALLLAVIVGFVMAYSERVGGDNGPYVLLGAFLAIIVAIAILLQWRLGALLLPATLPIEGLIKTGSLTSGTKALALLTFVSFAFAMLRERGLFEKFLRLCRQPLVPILFIFVLWVFASILWASQQGEAFTRTSTFVGLLGVTVIVGMLEERHLVQFWVIAALSATLSVPAAYVLPQSGKMAEVGRFGPAGADPNSYACLLAIVFFVFYFGLRRYKLAPYVLIPVLFYGIFATQSRTGLVALVATPVLAAFVPRLAARLGLRTLLVYILGATALAVVVLAIPSIGEGVAGRYSELSQIQSEGTWSGRLSIWSAALRVIVSHPFLGVGAGNFAQFTFQDSAWVAAHSAKTGEISGVAHNIFLGITSELGIVGLVLFLGVLFFAFKSALSASRVSNLGVGILLGLIVFMIAGMTLEWEYHKIGYVLFGSVLALQLQQGRSLPLSNEREAPY